MYTKQAVQNKLNQLHSLAKQVEYMIKRNEGQKAVDSLRDLTEKLEDIQTLINRETQS